MTKGPLEFKVFDHNNNFIGVTYEAAVLKYFPLPIEAMLVGKLLKRLASGLPVQFEKYLIVPMPKKVTNVRNSGI